MRSLRLIAGTTHLTTLQFNLSDRSAAIGGIYRSSTHAQVVFVIVGTGNVTFHPCGRECHPGFVIIIPSTKQHHVWSLSTVAEGSFFLTSNRHITQKECPLFVLYLDSGPSAQLGSIYLRDKRGPLEEAKLGQWSRW